jgi:outer membrane protein assembly factor BamB
MEGMHSLRAVDAYNGRRLWEHPLPNILKAYHGEHLMGTSGTQSNYCVTNDGVYVRASTSCLRLDLATGKKLGEYPAPRARDNKDGEGKEVPWGYIACEGAILFGSLADTRHVVKHTYGKADMSQLHTESVALFALDALSGKPKWTYRAKHSIRHNAIAIGGGRVYLIDRPAAAKDLLDGDKTKEHPSGELVVLDAATGVERWRRAENVYGTVLAFSAAHDVLLMSYQPTRFKLPSEIGGRLAAFRASSGERLWDVEANYVTRPLINGRTIYTQGASLDLLTGAKQPFLAKRSYGCGQLAGATNLLTFRSATLGYYDLLSPKGVIDYGGVRPGCWINAIPAGGLVLVPDATSGCQCSYLNQAWIALQPME